MSFEFGKETSKLAIKGVPEKMHLTVGDSGLGIELEAVSTAVLLISRHPSSF